MYIFVDDDDGGGDKTATICFLIHFVFFPLHLFHFKNIYLYIYWRNDPHTLAMHQMQLNARAHTLFSWVSAVLIARALMPFECVHFVGRCAYWLLCRWVAATTLSSVAYGHYCKWTLSMNSLNLCHIFIYTIFRFLHSFLFLQILFNIIWIFAVATH